MNADQWDVLDFGDVDTNLARKLNDGDIGGILVCINAVNTLKVLKLTGCVNVIGRGFDPLVGSVILEEIDFSIVGQHENSGVEPELMMSQGIVRSFLEGIISNTENSLRHIQLPQMWRDWQSSALIQFMREHETQLGGSCRICSNRCEKCRAFVSGKCLGVNYELSHLCKLCEESDIVLVMNQTWCSRAVALVTLQENNWELGTAIISLVSQGMLVY